MLAAIASHQHDHGNRRKDIAMMNRDFSTSYPTDQPEHYISRTHMLMCAADTHATASAARALYQYPIRDEYSYIEHELMEVYTKREALYRSIGAYDGLYIWEQKLLTEQQLAQVDSIYTLTGSRGIASDVQLRSEIREHYLKPARWRLSLHPGAIISAADGELACFCESGSHEQVALQMALDRYVAVLEPISDGGERMQGFQIVALSSAGFISYGVTYPQRAYSYERAQNIAWSLTKKVFDLWTPSHIVQRDALATLILKATASHSSSPMRERAYLDRLLDTEGGRAPHDTLPGGSQPAFDWYPLDGFGYEEQRIYPTDRRHYTGVHIYATDRDAERVDMEELCDRGLHWLQCAECSECGRVLYDDDYYTDPHDLLDDAFFCDADCLEQAYIREADAHLRGVYLFGGYLYSLD